MFLPILIVVPGFILRVEPSGKITFCCKEMSKSLKIRLLNMDLINNYNSLIMIINIFLPVILFILIILTIQFNIRPKYE